MATHYQFPPGHGVGRLVHPQDLVEGGEDPADDMTITKVTHFHQLDNTFHYGWPKLITLSMTQFHPRVAETIINMNQTYHRNVNCHHTDDTMSSSGHGAHH